MTWRDDLLPAKLNGLEFLYREVQSTGGRRTQVFEFPTRENPFVEDLGRSAYKWAIQAFLIGDNYHVTRDDLLDILDTAGELTFQHPYRGEYKVRLLGEYTVSENDTEGGVCDITFTLVESGESTPEIHIASPAKVKKLAAATKTTLAKNTRFDMARALANVRNSALAGLYKATSALRKINGAVSGALSVVDSAVFALDEFQRQLTTLMDTPQKLMNKLLALQTQMQTMVRDFSPAAVLQTAIDKDPAIAGIMQIKDTSIADAEDVTPVADVSPLSLALDMGDTMTEFESAPYDPDVQGTDIPAQDGIIANDSEQSEIEVTAHVALELVMRAGGLAALAETLTEIPFESAQQAETILADMTAKFRALLLTDDLDKETFQVLSLLQTAFVEYVRDSARGLPTVSEYDAYDTIPALLIAHELYDDCTRDSDIVTRNRVAHPGFVPGGSVLEVLSE